MRIELHAHTDASNIRGLDCINKVELLIQHAHDMGLQGITITDHDTVTNHIKALKYITKAKASGKISKDFRLLLGNEIYLVSSDVNAENYQKGTKFYHFILIAKDEIGHRQIRELSSRAWQQSFTTFVTRVPTYYEDLEEVISKEPGHLIATSACMGSLYGDTYKAKDFKRAKDFTDFCVSLFKDDFYLEIQPGQKDQQKYNEFMYELHQQTGVPMVVANDVHYLSEGLRPIHKAYLQAQEGDREVDDFYSHTYLMTNEKIHAELKYLPKDAVDMAIENTLKIGEKVKNYDLKGKPHIASTPYNITKETLYPYLHIIKQYPEMQQFHDSAEENDTFLIGLIFNGLERINELENKEYHRRIATELEEIWRVSEQLQCNMSGYFTTMAKIMELIWEKGNSLVGPGRGSAAASLIAFLLDITQVDPLREEVELPNWRFLYRDRLDVADIDFDTEESKRDHIFNVVYDFYTSLGGDVINVCTLGTEGTKSTIQTACKGLGIDNDFSMYLSSLVPVERGAAWTISECYIGTEERNALPEFISAMDSKPGLYEVCAYIEGLIARRGIHASGVVITNFPFVEIGAKMKSPNGATTTQWNLDDTEYTGGLKYDFLSIGALDKIHTTMDLLVEYGYVQKKPNLREQYEDLIGIYKIRDNPEVWKPISEAKIMDLFQFNTSLAIDALKKTHPQTVLELANVNSLMRLMPQGMENPILTYQKHKEDIERWHLEMKDYGLNEQEIEIMEHHLGRLYGVADSQESVMLLCMDKRVANFDYKKANKLRKGIGKKITEVVEEVKEMFFAEGEKAGARKVFLHYVWDVQISRQIG